SGQSLVAGFAPARGPGLKQGTVGSRKSRVERFAPARGRRLKLPVRQIARRTSPNARARTRAVKWRCQIAAVRSRCQIARLTATQGGASLLVCNCSLKTLVPVVPRLSRGKREGREN